MVEELLELGVDGVVVAAAIMRAYDIISGVICHRSDGEKI